MVRTMGSSVFRAVVGLVLASGFAACGGAPKEPAASEAAADVSAAPSESAAPVASGEASEAAVAPAASASPSASASASPSATPSASASAAAAKPAAAPAAAVAAAAVAAPMAAPGAFGICKACHAVEKGKNGIGPSLAGVYGTKAGDVPGYAFSPALKASGLVWNDATLDKWLESPMKMVPGTKMTYSGQSDKAKRAEIIAYLKSLK